MNNFILIALLLAAGVSQIIGQRDELYGQAENSCSQQGGLCILGSECDVLQRAALGLCPEQQNSGFECCHGLPKNERRCQKHGGECFKKNTFCAPKLTFSRAEDCAEDEHCCILV